MKDYLNSKQKKLSTNGSLSKAKSCQYSDKSFVPQNQSLIKNNQVLAYFFLYKNVFANTCIRNAQFDLFNQDILLTKVKQFSNLLEIKKK